MKPGTYVVCAVENVEKLLLGRVERELSSPDRIVAEIHNSVYITLPRFRVQRLPNRQVDAAKHAMNHPIATAAGVADLVALALVVPVMILETGSGGAILRVLSALGGSGVGGIIIISVAPAGLSATALERLCAKRENDSVTKKVVGAASATGVVVGTSVAVAAVSEAGAVVGLSASGMTAGLSAIGGSMVGGLAVCALIAASGVVVVGGVTWIVTNKVQQHKLEGQYRRFLQHWRGQGYMGPP